MSDYPDAGDMDKGRTVVRTLYQHWIDPTVTATQAPPILVTGGVQFSPNLNLLNGAYHDEVTPLPQKIAVTREAFQYHCAGPGCEKLGQWNEIDNWIRVAGYLESNRYFCSLDCLGGWVMHARKQEHDKQQTL